MSEQVRIMNNRARVVAAGKPRFLETYHPDLPGDQRKCRPSFSGLNIWLTLEYMEIFLKTNFFNSWRLEIHFENIIRINFYFCILTVWVTQTFLNTLRNPSLEFWKVLYLFPNMKIFLISSAFITTFGPYQLVNWSLARFFQKPE